MSTTHAQNTAVTTSVSVGSPDGWDKGMRAFAELLSA